MPGKFKIVVSDFHLGAGTAKVGDNPLEDFVADEEFTRFLEVFRIESERDDKEVELIINGDFFEFLQVPAVDTFDPQLAYPPEAYSASSQADSIKKLDLIISGHPLVFHALADFIQVKSPRRRLTIIKGNHDVNLFWPGVKQRLRDVLRATGRRASLVLFAEQYVSREGIYVEHGHQYAEWLNRWDDFDDPRDRENPNQLLYPPGSKLVLNFFNQVEHDRSWADSLKPLTALAWYCLEWDFEFAAHMLLNLASYAPVIGTGKENDPGRSLDALCRQLDDAGTRQTLSEQYRESLDFRREFHTRVACLIVPAASPPGMFVWPMPPADESAVEIARAEIEEIQASMRRVAARVANAEGARVIIFGHTHRPGIDILPDGTMMINCGTWQWLGGFAPTAVDVWRHLFAHPDQLEPRQRLTYARIDYTEQNALQAQLLDFTWPKGGVVPERPVALKRIWGWLQRLMRRGNG